MLGLGAGFCRRRTGLLCYCYSLALSAKKFKTMLNISLQLGNKMAKRESRKIGPTVKKGRNKTTSSTLQTLGNIFSSS